VKNSLILTVGYLLLAACVGENASEENTAKISDAELTGNRGQVLSSIQVPGYTYIEVRNNGRSRWLAGNPVEVVDGEVISWGESAVMQNFTSNALKRTFEELVFVSAVYRGTDSPPPVARSVPTQDSGIVRSSEDAAGYTYIEVETDAGEIIWIAAPVTALTAGDRVEWQGASKMTDFTSASLERTFPEILFVGGVSISK